MPRCSRRCSRAAAAMSRHVACRGKLSKPRPNCGGVTPRVGPPDTPTLAPPVFTRAPDLTVGMQSAPSTPAVHALRPPHEAECRPRHSARARGERHSSPRVTWTAPRGETPLQPNVAGGVQWATRWRRTGAVGRVYAAGWLVRDMRPRAAASLHLGSWRMVCALGRTGGAPNEQPRAHGGAMWVVGACGPRCGCVCHRSQQARAARHV